jgi:hypothetical protein
MQVGPRGNLYEGPLNPDLVVLLHGCKESPEDGAPRLVLRPLLSMLAHHENAREPEIQLREAHEAAWVGPLARLRGVDCFSRGWLNGLEDTEAWIRR